MVSDAVEELARRFPNATIRVATLAGPPSWTTGCAAEMTGDEYRDIGVQDRAASQQRRSALSGSLP